MFFFPYDSYSELTAPALHSITIPYCCRRPSPIPLMYIPT